MKKRYLMFQKGSGISPYIWSVFSILPFYFIFQSSSTPEIIVGICLTILFFIAYRFAFISYKWPVYLWTCLLIGISITMTILFHFIYFAFYIAYYNGKIKNKIAFTVLYIIHLIATTVAININVVMRDELFLKQIPFVVIIWIAVILLPFNLYNKRKQDQLEEQLDVANKRISELIIQEERQRIARDLHDTLGQKLSLIGLKSDLARKVMTKNPDQAKSELKDVQQTARTALNEVRQMVSQMRGIRLKEEFVRIKQILDAAQIDLKLEHDLPLKDNSLFLENILSMCLKEAVTNVVKHSKASKCTVTMEQLGDEIRLTIRDNGVGMTEQDDIGKGSGLLGIRERLEFVNGQMEISGEQGTTIRIKVPKMVNQREQEEKA
ncbi:histidine kinase [Sutcliffiella horikoshii]|uniref:histidine kinase n=1 Tax=Sutcliffiella horikoshii TaxID=79883 RepID=A0A1Y0CML1_9BACI|nr:sensor histidine kinase [Sutcliffiella horikoshii]ART76521.1 sensor histidine kinase [Sutcliffiella horikoshii]TYS57793.1 sensor histidine kinase [Sutcliffiella horikoshii]